MGVSAHCYLARSIYIIPSRCSPLQLRSQARIKFNNCNFPELWCTSRPVPWKIRVENFQWKVLARCQRPNPHVPEGVVRPQLLRGNPPILLYIGFVCHAGIRYAVVSLSANHVMTLPPDDSFVAIPEKGVLGKHDGLKPISTTFPTH